MLSVASSVLCTIKVSPFPTLLLAQNAMNLEVKVPIVSEMWSCPVDRGTRNSGVRVISIGYHNFSYMYFAGLENIRHKENVGSKWRARNKSRSAVNKNQTCFKIVLTRILISSKNTTIWYIGETGVTWYTFFQNSVTTAGFVVHCWNFEYLLLQILSYQFWKNFS